MIASVLRNDVLQNDGSVAAGLAAVAARVHASVVAVHGGGGIGSGVVWDDGLVVTNEHVVAGARDTEVRVELAEGATVAAEIVARDEATDLALLRPASVLDAPSVEARPSRSLRAGELVIAIGNPWGRRGEVTLGTVQRAVAPVEERGLHGRVYADVRLAPGNSGGPLADITGRVVGINSMVAGGLAAAASTEAVAALTSGWRARDGQPPGVLGLAMLEVELPAYLPPYLGAAGTGLLVTSVTPGGSAEAAGLIPGDLVVGVEGARGTANEVLRALRASNAGHELRLELVRGGETLILGAVPAAA